MPVKSPLSAIYQFPPSQIVLRLAHDLDELFPARDFTSWDEAIDPLIMSRRPRAVGQPIVDRATLTVALLQGLTMLLMTVAVFLLALVRDRSDASVRSVTFVTLVAGNLAVLLVNRSWRLSAWRTLRERRNRALPWAVAGASNAASGR